MKVAVETGLGGNVPLSPSQRFAIHLEALAYMQFATVSGLSIANSQVYAVLLACGVWFAFIYLAYRVRATDLHRQRLAANSQAARNSRSEEN
jgi:hypothetical protein